MDCQHIINVVVSKKLIYWGRIRFKVIHMPKATTQTTMDGEFCHDPRNLRVTSFTNLKSLKMMRTPAFIGYKRIFI